jgi:hypothetical protein
MGSGDDDVYGVCYSRYLLLGEAALGMIIALAVAGWTWRRSRSAIRSTSDGQSEDGRMVLLPAYQVIIMIAPCIEFVCVLCSLQYWC